MQSMTGYGRCRVCRDGRELLIELKSVNHRFLDIAFRVPKNLSFLEDELRVRINQSMLKRGHIDIFLAYQNTREDARAVCVDEEILASFSAAIKRVEKELADFKRLTQADALTLSGALTVTQAEEDAGAVSELAAEAVDGAMKALTEMRTREGAHLAMDLLGNREELSALCARMAQRAPTLPEEYRRRLTTRLEEWKIEGADPQRVAQEVALMADRCAIDEELNRLESHLAQFEKSVQGEAEVGRKLDFLLQEMNREVNTIGSKASDAEIAQTVVEAKCLIEKLREQVQNAV